LVKTRIHDGGLVSSIESLEHYFRSGNTTISRAAFEHSYFAPPDRVRQKTPYYPDRARYSREHYPKLDKGDCATWQGREVRLDDNSAAQRAWKSYTGRLERASGYSVRHIWGHPWNPDAFTAGWNLCYMPFWAGMLTEPQHPHPELEAAVRQAAWDLYFRDNPVCAPPEFVTNPGIDLDALLDDQPILLLSGRTVDDEIDPQPRSLAREAYCHWLCYVVEEDDLGRIVGLSYEEVIEKVRKAGNPKASVNSARSHETYIRKGTHGCAGKLPDIRRQSVADRR